MAEDYYSLKNEILVGNNAKTIRDHLVELENNPKIITVGGFGNCFKMLKTWLSKKNH